MKKTEKRDAIAVTVIKTAAAIVKIDWLVVLFYGISTLFGLFNAELSHFDKSFKQISLA